MLVFEKKASNSFIFVEAEYISAASDAQEAKWIIPLLNKRDLQQTLAISLLKDNHACIKMNKSEIYHSKNKRIDLPYHVIRNLVQEKVIYLQYIEAKLKPADPF